MKHNVNSIEQTLLNVSELHITDKPKKIKTRLGSCLAIIMFVPRLKLSAICHARLPHGECTPSKKNGFCYVDGNVDYMLESLCNQGAQKSELIIKAFSGAQMLPSRSSEGQSKKPLVMKILPV